MRISDWSSDVCSSDLNTNPRPPRRRADVRRTCRRLPSRRGCRTMPQRQTEEPMKAVEAVCENLKREGIELITGYPVNHVLAYAARADIPTVDRKNLDARTGVHRRVDFVGRHTSNKQQK